MDRKHLRHSASLIVMSFTALAAPAKAADDRCPTGTDCDIVVIANAESRASSATKTDTPIIASPQQISIVNRDEMELRASPTVADALAYTAGVQSEPAGIDNRVDEVSVRGFGAGGFSSNNNFVDGLRIPAGGEGTWLRPAFDPFALDSIEVLKGPSGALYGQSAPGGIINMVTKRPSFTPHGEVMFQGAGFTGLRRWSWQGAVDLAGPLNADRTVAGRLVGLARAGATQTRGVESSRYYIAPGVTWRIGPDTHWTLLGQYQRDEGGSSFQFLPALGTLYRSAGRRLSNDAFLGEDMWNRFDRNQYLLASMFEHRFGDIMTVRSNIRYTHLDIVYEGVMPIGNTLVSCAGAVPGCIPGRTLHRRAVHGTGETRGLATDNQVELRGATGPVDHILLGGFDYFHTESAHSYDLVQRNLVRPLLDIFTPVQTGTAGFASSLTPVLHMERAGRQAGVYLQDQLSIGRLRVTVGGRQDRARDRGVNTQTGKSLTTRSAAFTWRAGAVWLFDNGLAPYASYSESFQPLVSSRDPSASQLRGNTPFAPTTGQQYEAGLRFRHGEKLYITLGAYRITQQNLTTPDPSGELCGLSVCQVQTGEGRVRGIELEGKTTLPWNMTVIATTTRSDSEVTKTTLSGQKGNRLPQIPDWMASLFVSQRTAWGSRIGGGVRHTGKSVGDTANMLRIPQYTLFDLFLRHDFGIGDPRLDGLSLSVNARNVADKRFVASCSGASNCYIGQGRSVTARLQFRW